MTSLRIASPAVVAVLAVFTLAATPGLAQDAGPEPRYDPNDPVGVLARMPPDVRGRLEGHEIVSIVEAQKRGGLDEDVVIPTVFFGTIVVIVLLFVLLRMRRDQKLHETLRAMIDKGVDIPPALLVPPQAKKNDRRTGIILAMAGLGVSGFIYVVDQSRSGAWGLGFVPLCLGLGYLIAHVLDVRASRAEPSRGAPASVSTSTAE